jgi:glucans biosynthesis protein
MRTINFAIAAVIAAAPLLAYAQGTPPLARPRPATPDFAGIRAIARELASRPYQDHRRPLSQRLTQMGYDEIKQIVFDERKAVWRRERLPFQMHFFHPGGRQDQIDFNLIDGEEIDPVPFSREFFDYGANTRFSWMDFRDAKFSGFKVVYPLNRPDKLDEVIVFHGASYYRAVPAGLVYGLSARALAVNCGGEGPEEFPHLREFWVERPDREGRALRILAIIDSPSVAGAAELLVEPGPDTVVRVRLSLLPRVELARCGLAPLTSMFWYGKNTQRQFSDFRPEVHDSDGLLVHTGSGEWLWRPLDNTGKMRNSAFADRTPKGFGLMQRERDQAQYEDLHANYHARPSAWVRPKGDWGAGSVRLVEIPTEDEFHDNIVAFWEPAQPLKAGQPADFAYDVVWCGEKADLPALGRVVACKSGTAAARPRARRFMLDFKCPGLDRQGEAFAPEVVVTALHGRIADRKDQFNEFRRAWRVLFDVIADEGADAVELRARLQKGGAACTETWTYCWVP